LLLKLFNEEDEVAVGRVLSPHGVTGMVKVYPYSDHPERVSLLDLVALVNEAGRVTYSVEQSAQYGRFWLIKFQGIDTREAAASIGGRLLIIPKEKRLPLPEGSFYHDQLVGLNVYSVDNRFIGVVSDVITTGGHDLLQVRPDQKQKKNILVPAVKKIIKEVNLEKNLVLVELPEGLQDL